MLCSALLFYCKLWDNLVNEYFEMNPFDPCVANKIINGKQMTVCFHVDDLLMLHHEEEVIREFARYLEGIYGKLEVTIGDELEYLGMKFRFSDGAVSISQEAFTRETIEEFPEMIDTTAEDPASATLFNVREPSAKNMLLGPEQAQAFH